MTLDDLQAKAEDLVNLLKYRDFVSEAWREDIVRNIDALSEMINPVKGSPTPPATDDFAEPEEEPVGGKAALDQARWAAYAAAALRGERKLLSETDVQRMLNAAPRPGYQDSRPIVTPGPFEDLERARRERINAIALPLAVVLLAIGIGLIGALWLLEAALR